MSDDDATRRDAIASMERDAVLRAYVRWAPLYDLTFGKVVDVGRREAIRIINQRSGKLLEVGVGTGLSLTSYHRGLSVTGIDMSPEMLAKARKRVERKSVGNVESLLIMDAEELKFPDNSFDVVSAMYVITVVPDPLKAMKELERVCRIGGEVFVLNHFSKPDGVRGRIEKGMRRYSQSIGWRPDLPVEAVLPRGGRLRLQESIPLNPFKLFTLMRFVKAESDDSPASP